MFLDGEKVVSSEELARLCQVNPSQIRKDLAYFGEFGVRGVGYYVQDLSTAIKQSLGVDRVWNAALVGVGNLGRALLRSRMFRRRGFFIVGAFDCDPFKIGEEIAGLDIICTQHSLVVPKGTPFELISRDLRDIGKVVGQSELGDKKAEEFEGQLAKFDESKPGKGQTAALLFYFSPEYPVMSVSNASIEGQMMERLGLENIFADEKAPYLEEVN